MYNTPSYKISFILAIALHIALAIMLCIKISSMEKQPVMQSNTNIIKAFSISTATQPPQPPQIQQQKTSTPTLTQPPSQQQKQPEQNKNIEQQKEKKLQQQRDLETTLKQQMFAAQNEEAKNLKKELQMKNKELTTIQKTQEKQILHHTFTDELNKEDKQLQNSSKQLNQAVEASTSNTTNTNNVANNPQTQGEIDKYKALIIQAISQEWIVPDDVDKNTSCKLLINLGPGGVVLRVQILQPSNNPLLDRSAQNAVWKASPLPIPQDNNLLDNFRSIQLTVRPEEISS